MTRNKRRGSKKRRKKKKKSRPDEDELSNQASKRSYKTCHTNNFFECTHTHAYIHMHTHNNSTVCDNTKLQIVSCISREAADGWIHSYIGIWLNVVMYIYYNTYIQMNEVIWGKRSRKQKKNKTLLSIINANVVRKKIRKLSKSHS